MQVLNRTIFGIIALLAVLLDVGMVNIFCFSSNLSVFASSRIGVLGQCFCARRSLLV